MGNVKRAGSELEFAATIGIDWSDRKHDVCLMEAGSSIVEYDVIEQSPEALSAWTSQLSTRFKGKKIAICLEQSRGALINALMNYEFLVLYPVNPKTLNKYREAFTTSKAKDDPSDAYLAMELVSRHRDKLRAWKPDDELTRSIKILTETRRKTITLRTRMTNKLKAMLKEYFPQALKLTGVHLYSIMSCDLLLRWPTLEAIKKEERKSIRKFYYGHHFRRGDIITKYLDIIEKATPLTTDKAIIETSVINVKMLANQLRTLAYSIREYDKELEERYSSHPDKEIFCSLPGSGSAVGPRLLAAFGTDRNRYESAEDIQMYSGIAPVTRRSGKSCWVHKRWACPKFLLQSFHEFANQSIKYSAWARAYYEQQRAKGCKHHVAIRSLAFKWIRIIFRCWKNRAPYNEAKYIMALKRRGSSLLSSLAKTT